MFEIKGKYTTAKVMIDNVEESCVSQITHFVNHPAFTNPVAIMPDTHAGKGSVIGFTMKLTDKIIPNVIGVDIGCFTGETKIMLADNRDLSFVELLKEHQEGKENFCFSKDRKGNIAITKILNVLETRTVTEIVEIVLDNNKTIRCTKDHIFYTKDQKEIEAKELKKGQSLFPLYLKKAKEAKTLLSKTNKYLQDTDYLVVFNPSTLKYDFVHVLADNYNTRKTGEQIKAREIRHHRDFDKLNNNPTNIQRLSWKAHWEVHAKHASILNKQGRSGWKVSWERHLERFKKYSSEKMRKNLLDPDFQRKRDIASANNFRTFCKTDKFKEMSKLAGQRGKQYLSQYNISPRGIENSKKVSSRIYECPVCLRVFKGPIAVNSHKRIHEGLQFKDFAQIENHKIKFIKTIKCKPTKVYCLTVEEFHNFALTAGVFVHNCGMLSLNFGKVSGIANSLPDLDKSIRKKIPFGKNVHEKSIIHMKDEFPWDKANSLAQKFSQAYREHYGEMSIPRYSIEWFLEKCKQIGGDTRRFINSLGTLGGGNHFIETGIDESGQYWITIHSGSRNFGKRICEYWQGKAEKFHKHDKKSQIKEQIEKLKLEITDNKVLFDKIKELKSIDKPGIDMKGCEWLEGDDALGYLLDMIFAQVYAETNRKHMGKIIQDIVGISPIETIETIHNFIDFHDFIIRKGSVRSYSGEKFILPFNMKDGILICEGKSNSEWNYSSPHGAGRVMSRAQAKKLVDLETFKSQMSEIYSTSVGTGTLDEAPDAYKPSKIIEEAIFPTATILNRIKPIHNMKDSLGQDD
jgi:RNA-splicing ligase RtcB